MVDVILLGTGATGPTPERGVSAAVLRCGGRGILFDCGEGTQTALQRERVSPGKLDLIALTHYHGDHIFGLPGLLQTMNCQKRTEPLYITGPEGLEEVMEPILRLTGETEYAIRLFPAPPPEGLPLQSLHPHWPVSARLGRFPTAHRVPSQGYSFRLDRPAHFLPEKARALGVPVSEWRRIMENGPSEPVRVNGEIRKKNDRALRGADLMGPPRRGLHIVLSGDTMPCEATRSAARGADLLIHDATYADSAREEQASLWGHSTFRQAAELARDAGAAELWLTHFSQSVERPDDGRGGAADVFPNTVCGYDGLAKTLRFPEE